MMQLLLISRATFSKGKYPPAVSLSGVTPYRGFAPIRRNPNDFVVETADPDSNPVKSKDQDSSGKSPMDERGCNCVSQAAHTFGRPSPPYPSEGLSKFPAFSSGKRAFKDPRYRARFQRLVHLRQFLNEAVMISLSSRAVILRSLTTN
jgi:hypothetical protein